MSTFPRITVDRAAYEHELTRHLHDPFNFRLTKAFWNGTDDFADIIAREGFETYRADLQLVRASIQQRRHDIAVLRDFMKQQDDRAAHFQRSAKSAETEPKYHRDARHGQMVKTDRSHEIAQHERDMSTARMQADAANTAIKRLESEMKRWLEGDARLSAGLMACLSREQAAADTPAAPPAPVINVSVEAPVVNLEATVEVPPIQISEVAITALPDRKTTTVIERNTAGEITKSTQVEVDA